MSDKQEVKQCLELVYRPHMFRASRCFRKATHGDYCKQHAPIDKTVGAPKFMIEYGKIRKVIVNRETDAFMWIDGNNCKQTKKPLFDTFEQAKEVFCKQLADKCGINHEEWMQSVKDYQFAVCLEEKDVK